MMRGRDRFVLGVIGLFVIAPATAQRASLSTRPDTPFKLATFEAGGKVRLGMTAGAGGRLVDLAEAGAYVAQKASLPPVQIPNEMRALIEAYDRVSPRLYAIANYFHDSPPDALPFAFDAAKASIKAPIKYPYNLLCAAANYRSHANEMFARGTPQSQAVNEIDPEKIDPVFFAKSPRSCIIDPGDAFIMPPNRNIDWEGELAIVIGKTALNVAEARAHDYVFGYSIMYDVSDRGGEGRPLSAMFPGPNWFSGKSRDRAAPFGPYIVPKEFLPNHGSLRIVTRVNGAVKQDGNSRDLIWDEAHMIRYLTSILTLYPGDVISSGTPDGVGAGRKPPEFLKPGDVVTIEIEGIGTLTTPMRASSARASQ